MLQIKNTLGGGKPNAPYAWAKYNTIENPIYYINPSFTAKVITAGSVFEIVTSSFDASKVDTSFFEGFEFDVNTVNLSVYKENEKYYISKGGNLSSPREFTYDPTTMRFNINNLSDSIGTKLPLNGGNYTGNKPTGEYEIVADSLVEYIIDDSPNKYPNGEVHTDGYFYRYAPEGLYAWKKNSYSPAVSLENPTFDYISATVSSSSSDYTFGNFSFDISIIDDWKKFFTGFVNTNGYGSNFPSYGVFHNYSDNGNWNYTVSEVNLSEGTVTIHIGGYCGDYESEGTYKYTGTKVVSEEIKEFIGYIVSDKETAYPNGEVHTDGYFYRYAPEGLYAWKKHEIGSEPKEINESVSTLPYSFYGGSAVMLNGEIHILGGAASTKKHYKWDGTNWTSVSTLPYEFCFGAAVVLNGEIHILGSDYSSSYYKYHYKWNGSSWTSVSALPYNFYYGSAVVLDGEIHILGGSHDSSTDRRHYKFDGSSWTTVSTLPYNFYRGSAVVLNGEIHIFGTYGNSAFYKSHYKWDGSSWISVSTLPYNFFNGSAVVFNNEIHILGGDGINYHYEWNGLSWTSASTLPYKFSSGGAVVYNDAIHTLGSSNDSAYYKYHYSVYGYVPTYTFLDYIVSDKETAYPDGGEKDGYWYEKVVEGAKFTTGTVTPSSGNWLRVEHGLGVTPDIITVMAESSNTSVLAYALHDIKQPDYALIGNLSGATKVAIMYRDDTSYDKSSSYGCCNETFFSLPYYQYNTSWGTSLVYRWVCISLKE